MFKKILVFEFIIGGGLAQDDLPESLAREGLLMLKTLVEELSQIPSIQLTVLLDWRYAKLDLAKNINTVVIAKNSVINDVLAKLIEESDLVWPIAPESDLILQKISALVEAKNRRLLNSSAEAVTLCSDKLLTAKLLKQQGIAVIESRQLNGFIADFVEPKVIKPKDGVGCLNCYYVSCNNEFEQIVGQIEQPLKYIYQPYINGDTLSLSCLFKKQKAWLLCCNRQQVSMTQGRFQLNACEINIPTKNRLMYQQIINQIAKIIPGLWGYVGIDIIQPEFEQALILEINPRLTTSYVGIKQSLGLNVAKIIVKMLDKAPEIINTQNKQHVINLI